MPTDAMNKIRNERLDKEKDEVDALRISISQTSTVEEVTELLSENVNQHGAWTYEIEHWIPIYKDITKRLNTDTKEVLEFYRLNPKERHIYLNLHFAAIYDQLGSYSSLLTKSIDVLSESLRKNDGTDAELEYRHHLLRTLSVLSKRKSIQGNHVKLLIPLIKSFLKINEKALVQDAFSILRRNIIKEEEFNSILADFVDKLDISSIQDVGNLFRCMSNFPKFSIPYCVKKYGDVERKQILNTITPENINELDYVPSYFLKYLEPIFPSTWDKDELWFINGLNYYISISESPDIFYFYSFLTQ